MIENSDVASMARPLTNQHEGEKSNMATQVADPHPLEEK